jgi:hypothetical protein
MEYSLQVLAKDWKWFLDSDQYLLLEISPFGDLFMKDKTGAFCLLDINFGELVYANSAGDDPTMLFPIAFDLRIASLYIQTGLLPVEGQCFGYKNPLVAQGSLEPDNVYVATLAEYVSFMGHLHESIQGVANGETVELKVINLPKVN